nr:immunoglobulin heavy chain junction region [Homo sapiens]
LCHFPPAPLL